MIYEDAPREFGFSCDGRDVIMLTAVDSTTGLDFFDFGRQQPDKCEGRFSDGSNNWVFYEPTRGQSTLIAEVENRQSIIPQTFILNQNFLNPFNPRTTISFSIATKQKVTLAIFDTRVQKIKRLADAVLSAGNHFFQWNAEGLPSGIYFYCFKAVSYAETKKMMQLS